MKKILIVLIFGLGSSFGIYAFVKGMQGHGIPLNTLFLEDGKFLMNYVNPQNSDWKLVLHDYKNGNTKDISSGSIFSKCTPLYYNDSLIVGYFEVNSKHQYATLHLKTFQSGWISDEKMNELMPSLANFSYPEQLEKSNYPPQKLPEKLFTDESFKAANYIKDNNNKIIRYQNKPLLAVYTNEIYQDFVNRYSKNNWHIRDYISRKCYIGLYDESTKSFEWVIKKNLDNEAFYKMTLFYGVHIIDEQKILVVNHKNTEIIDLSTGEIQEQSEI